MRGGDGVAGRPGRVWRVSHPRDPEPDGWESRSECATAARSRRPLAEPPLHPVPRIQRHLPPLHSSLEDVHPPFERSNAPLDLCLKLDKALLELRIESREVQLVELPAGRRDTWHLQPGPDHLHEPSGDFFAEPVVEVLRQTGGHWHRRAPREDPPRVQSSTLGRAGRDTRPGGAIFRQ